MDSFEYIAIATTTIPFLVGGLRMLLERFKLEVRPQTLVAIVCAVLGAGYAILSTVLSVEMFAKLSFVVGTTFVASQEIYKRWKSEKK
jgi:hypothetical protein